MHSDHQNGLERIGNFAKASHPEFIVFKRKLRQAEAIQLVRVNRDTGNRQLGFASRPFVFAGYLSSPRRETACSMNAGTVPSYSRSLSIGLMDCPGA